MAGDDRMCGHRCCRAGRCGRERGRAPRRRAARRRRDTTGSVATGAAGLGTPAAWPWWMALTYWLRLAASGPSLAQASRLRARMALGRRWRMERRTSSATERRSLAARPRTRASSSGRTWGGAAERRSTTGARRRPPCQRREGAAGSPDAGSRAIPVTTTAPASAASRQSRASEASGFWTGARRQARGRPKTRLAPDPTRSPGG
jgi:hypothetical protein